MKAPLGTAVNPKNPKKRNWGFGGFGSGGSRSFAPKITPGHGISMSKDKTRICPICAEEMRSDHLYRHFATHDREAVQKMPTGLRLQLLEAKKPIITNEEATVAVCLKCKKGADKENRKNPNPSLFYQKHECTMSDDDGYENLFKLIAPPRICKPAPAGQPAKTIFACNLCANTYPTPYYLYTHMTHFHIKGPIGKLSDINPKDDILIVCHTGNPMIKHKSLDVWYCGNLTCDAVGRTEKEADAHNEYKACRKWVKMNYIHGSVTNIKFD